MCEAETTMQQLKPSHYQQETRSMTTSTTLMKVLLILISLNHVTANPVGQLFGYVKDSVQKTMTGCGDLYKNHGKCNAIRKKIKLHRDGLIEEYNSMMPLAEARERANRITAGISYAEYVFLQTGKQDRGKVFNLMFLMWGAPRFLPYALLFNPDMLPSPFQQSQNKMQVQQQRSRDQSAAIIRMLLDLEKQVHEQVGSGALQKTLSMFSNKSKQQAAKDKLQLVYRETAETLVEADHHDDPLAAQQQHSLFKKSSSPILRKVEPFLFRSLDDFSRAEKRLVHVPAVIVKGLTNAFVGGNNGFFGALQPHFMTRGKLVGQLRKIAEADDFLVQAKIDLSTVESDLLLEACQERMIGGSSVEDLQLGLSKWLDWTVREPAARIQDAPTPMFFNDNLARMVLMGYHGCMTIRKQQHESGTDLLRLLFTAPSIYWQQPQQQLQAMESYQTEESQGAVSKRNRAVSSAEAKVAS